MSDALEDLGLSDLSWVFEDELDPDEVAEAATSLREALGKRTALQSDSAIALRWLAGFLDAVRDHGGGLTGRFAERANLRDRY